MKAIVVYESLLGNTAAIARAIAEGLGRRSAPCPPPPRRRTRSPARS
jgi:flavodoxin